MRRTSVKIKIPAASYGKKAKEQFDPSFKKQQTHGESALSNASISPKTLLGRQILILSRFIDNEIPNWKTDPNTFIVETIENFKKDYPNRREHDDVLKTMLQRFDQM